MRFFGRTRELDALRAAIAQPAVVTLWGPGGAGKTRLAREHVARSDRAVVWIDLASARTERDVAAAAAAALGVEADASLARACEVRRALVVADHVDRLDPAARALVASLGPHVLATSREPLGAPGEVTIAVGPLDDDAAIAMFEAASQAPCDSATARAIVARLDGLPLAIELAGARAVILGGPALLDRLDRKLDLLARLREAIASSWELLGDADRAALVACAAFEGSFDAALAEAAIGAGALDRIASLRARAMIQVGPPDAAGRPALRLLEAVRDFAREQGEMGHGPTGRHHEDAVLARCEPAADAVRRGGDALAELRARRADLVAIGSPRAVLALAALLAVTGPAEELRDRTTAAMRAGERVPELLVARAEAHRALGRLREAREDLEAARAEGATARVTADVERVLGAIARTEGRTRDAHAHLDDALARYRALGERALEGISIDEIGAALQSEGHLAAARERHAEAIAILRSAGSTRAEGTALSRLAVATHRGGDPAGALAIHEQSLALHRASGHTRLEGAELLHLGFVHHELASPGAARDAFAAARAKLAEAGARGLEAFAHVLAARLAADEGDATTALLALAEAAQLAPSSGGGWSRLTATRHLVAGHLAMSRGDPKAAAEAYRASLAASRDVEVGFEALTPAYLAVAEGRPVDTTITHENPHLAVALAILKGERVDDPAAIARSSEVRRALAFVGSRRGLRVEAGARTLVLPDGRSVDLARRKNVRAVLALLARERRARPGVPVAPDAILQAGWPGERMRADTGTKRLHTAIWTLRSLGLEGVLLTEGDGYLLDPSVPLIFEDL